MTIYRYLIGFTTPSTKEFGTVTLTLDHPILGRAEYRPVQQQLRSLCAADDLLLTSVTFLTEEDDDQQTGTRITGAADWRARGALDQNVARASSRLALAARPVPKHVRVVLDRLLEMLGSRLADGDGDGAVIVVKAIGCYVGIEISDAMLDYCLAVGVRNAARGGAR